MGDEGELRGEVAELVVAEGRALPEIDRTGRRAPEEEMRGK